MKLLVITDSQTTNDWVVMVLETGPTRFNVQCSCEYVVLHGRLSPGVAMSYIIAAMTKAFQRWGSGIVLERKWKIHPSFTAFGDSSTLSVSIPKMLLIKSMWTFQIINPLLQFTQRNRTVLKDGLFSGRLSEKRIRQFSPSIEINPLYFFSMKSKED